MGRTSYVILAAMTMLLFTTACNNIKYLPANESLYTGAKIEVKGPELKKKQRKNIKSELQALTRPRPNSKVLGMRIKLWLWNIGGNPKRKISVRRLIKKLGEPPVLMSSVNVERNVAILQNHLENTGYFRAAVEGDTVVKNRRGSAIYTAPTGKQYTINEVAYQKDSSDLQKAINRTTRRSLLKKDDPFNLDIIKAERLRVDQRLKQRGFYFFSPEYLLIDIDTTIGNSKVNLYVNTKRETPPEARRMYRIKDVVIYPTFSLNQAASDTNRRHGILYQGYYVVDSTKFYKPRLFDQAMQFDPGELYNRNQHNLTLTRLINLGIFKFVKNRFEVAGDTLLNAYYYLTPLPKQSLRAEIGGNTKSNNLTGSQVTVGYTNRNTFRGGEIMTINLTGGVEVQYSGQYKGFNTYRIGAEGNLAIPRFVVPFVTINPGGGFVPRTNIRLGYEILNRQKLYTLNSFNGAFGYLWKESLRKEHTFYPINIQYVQPVKVTPLYIESLQGDPTLQKIIDTQFILGATYNYLFNQLIPRVPDNAFYFNGNIDVSGNVAGLVKKGNAKAGDTARLFGAPFSQYVRLETDFRYYRDLGNKNVWANRIIIGAGFPYGNSLELPFIKQFFIGGNNSLRAFRSRSLGPGTYQAAPVGSRGFLPDQSGDLKLELNSELRFKVFHPLYGAAFVDAGNIWLYNDNNFKPGGKFTNDFMKELAVGTGLGVRVDINILVLRLDAAFPIRKPWLPENDRWVFDQIKFGDPDWRRENLIYNLAIGYPF
jgi:outer membrane protein insertion porin family